MAKRKKPSEGGYDFGYMLDLIDAKEEDLERQQKKRRR